MVGGFFLAKEQENIMIIMYKAANQHSVSAGPALRVVLNPGRNVVDNDVWDAILKASEKDKTSKGGVKYLIESGLIKIISDSDVNGSDLNIAEMKQDDAHEVIAAEVSIDNLQNFLNQENGGPKRKKTISLIEEKIFAMLEAEEQNSGSSDS